MKANRSISDQNGFVSIVVCMIIMTILTLITIGFAQIMNREQRQALDRQLSTQAFYAAESGINNAVLEPSGFTAATCSQVDVSASTGVKTTCITYSRQTQNYIADAVPIDQHTPEVFPLPIGTDRITIEFWPQISTGLAAFRPNTDLVPFGSWGTDPGAMKVQLLPFTDGDTRQSIVNNADSFIVIPRDTATGSANYKGGPYGRVWQAACSAGRCRLTITNVPVPSAARSLTMVLSSLYTVNSVIVTAYNSSNTVVPFDGVQAIVDSTGRTTDVVRRIQVRLPLIDGYRVPTGGLEATGTVSGDGICKLIEAVPSPGNTRNTAPCSGL